MFQLAPMSLRFILPPMVLQCFVACGPFLPWLLRTLSSRQDRVGTRFVARVLPQLVSGDASHCSTGMVSCRMALLFRITRGLDHRVYICYDPPR